MHLGEPASCPHVTLAPSRQIAGNAAITLAGRDTHCLHRPQARLQNASKQFSQVCLVVCVYYKIENVKEQHQGEAEGQSVERERKHP